MEMEKAFPIKIMERTHEEATESMTEAAIEIILQGAEEKCPDARPRIISDNGPQFIAKDFKEFIRISGMRDVRTSLFYLQSKAYASHCTSLGRSVTISNAGFCVQSP
jgi:putative transposase